MGEVARRPELVELIVGDEPDAWDRAGFDVRGTSTWIGQVHLRLVGEADGRGIRSWALAHVDQATDDVDGLPTAAPTEGELAPPHDLDHSNGVAGFDHLVVATPNPDRTLETFTAIGMELRRTRDFGPPERQRRQMFFWIGDPILEVVSPATATGDEPSSFWGIACTVADIDATAHALGDACSRPKDAVQPGRRIATLRHEPLGMSVPVAFMTAHVATPRPIS
jgi:hypothetical protein